MKICTRCATENSDHAHFCISCGAALDTAPAEASPTRTIPVSGIQRELHNRANASADAGQYESLPENGQIQDRTEVFESIREEDIVPESSFEQERESRSEDKEDKVQEQIERYKREQGDPRIFTSQEGTEDRGIKLIGIVLVLIVLVCGIVALNLFRAMEPTVSSRVTTAHLSNEMIQALTRQNTNNGNGTDSGSSISGSGSSGSAGEEQTVNENESPRQFPDSSDVKAELFLASDLDNAGFHPVAIKKMTATSTIVQEGFDNSAERAFDDNTNTSWQEGVSGSGVGETLTVEFDRVYNIHSMTFRLGNWSSQDMYKRNNRPQSLIIWLNDIGFEVTFPDEETEYAVSFSQDISADKAVIEISSVYYGDDFDDTCITDIGIFGS